MEISETLICPEGYRIINGYCFHSLWPPTITFLLGSVIIGVVNSFCTLAGVGGGSIGLVILMTFFQYLPKDASLVVFSCVLGGAAGNILSLVFKAYNGEPLVKFNLMLVSIPIVFAGSFIGILLNKLFPSIITYSIIIAVFLISVKKIYTRFATEFAKQSQEILLHGDNVENLHQESVAQPFKDERTVFILKNVAVLSLITVALSFLRGSSKFPSIIGLQPCSAAYWALFIFSFVFTLLYAYRNIQIFKTWITEPDAVGNSRSNVANFEEHIKQLVLMSVGAGIFSGFGLGGGIFLVPMYRNLGCKPLEATSTCAFGIFLASLLNCLQAISIGAVQISQFFYFVVLLGAFSYFISKKISAFLRKRNRFSFIDGFLLILTIIAIINIPIALYRGYADNGHNLQVIFGFGHIC